MEKRLDYIDAIKGFAIFLVVMGHVIPWMFLSLSEAQNIDKPMLLWKIVYAFHMPLFIFVSGYLFGLSHFQSLKKFLMKSLHKAERLLIPYFVCGVLVYMWRGVRPLTYWYLLTLFQLIVIVGGVNLIVERIKDRRISIVAEMMMLLIIHLFLYYAERHFHHPWLAAYDWFPHLAGMYPYFALGCFVARHLDIKNLLNNHVYSMGIMVFIALLFVNVLYTYIGGISLQALTGIYCTFYLFVVCYTHGTIIDYFKRIGKETLYIYILHFFFAFKIIQLGDYFIWLSQTGKMGYVTCFTLQLLYSIVVSFIIVRLTLFTAKLIKTSKILSLLLFGERA